MDSFFIPISTMEHQVQGTKQVLTTIKDKSELKKGDSFTVNDDDFKFCEHEAALAPTIG